MRTNLTIIEHGKLEFNDHEHNFSGYIYLTNLFSLTTRPEITNIKLQNVKKKNY